MTKDYNIFYVFCFYYISNIFQKQNLETYLQIYLYHSNYLGFLKNQRYLFPIDEFNNVPTGEKSGKNQRKLTVPSDRTPS